MSLEAQAKVLRALQENKISRIGSDTDIQIDVRVIAATNKNLKEEIAKGRFREDLYHRLSVIIIEVPPLKDRPEDIDELVTYFLETICNEMGIAQKNITPEALQALKSYEWTGNIRELRNVVERLIFSEARQSQQKKSACINNPDSWINFISSSPAGEIPEKVLSSTRFYNRTKPLSPPLPARQQTR